MLVGSFRCLTKCISENSFQLTLSRDCMNVCVCVCDCLDLSFVFRIANKVFHVFEKIFALNCLENCLVSCLHI